MNFLSNQTKINLNLAYFWQQKIIGTEINNGIKTKNKIKFLFILTFTKLTFFF